MNKYRAYVDEAIFGGEKTYTAIIFKNNIQVYFASRNTPERAIKAALNGIRMNPELTNFVNQRKTDVDFTFDIIPPKDYKFSKK